jgi:triacylglycerol esterase/lipase EstA (alpha/beta hydrolase family)
MPISVTRWLLLLPTGVFVLAMLMSFGGWVAQAVDRGEHVRITRSLLSLYTREALARVFVLLMAPFGHADRAPVRWGPPTAEPQVPVLLIPGYGTNRSALWFLCQYLASHGWTWIWPVNHARRFRPLEEHAALLAEQVQQLKSISGAPKVDLIGFSMGGLIAGWYLARLGGDVHVRRLVTIGAPWRGTRLGVFSRTRLGREMLWGSHSLDELVPPPVPTVCIWSPDDPIVVPARSAAAEGAQQVCVDLAGHLEMLFSGRVFRAVRSALSAEHP